MSPNADNTPAETIQVPASQHRRSPASRVAGTHIERCIYCQSTNVSRKGKRYKKHETVQLWYCRDCDRVFTPLLAKGKTFPLKVILESLMLYYRGHTKTETLRRIKERYGLSASLRTLTAWLQEHKPLTTYARLRTEGREVFSPHKLIRTTSSKTAIAPQRAGQNSTSTRSRSNQNRPMRNVQRISFSKP